MRRFSRRCRTTPLSLAADCPLADAARTPRTCSALVRVTLMSAEENLARCVSCGQGNHAASYDLAVGCPPPVASLGGFLSEPSMCLGGEPSLPRAKRVQRRGGGNARVIGQAGPLGEVHDVGNCINRCSSRAELQLKFWAEYGRSVSRCR